MVPFVLLSLLMTQPVATAPQPPPADLGVLVERLADDRWPVRETASAELIFSDAVTMAELEAALRRDDLNIEQRIRLIRAAQARFRAEPMGGLGVSFGPSGEGAVQIQGVVDNGMFPAAAVIKPGDVVVAIGAEMVAGQDHMRAEILSRRPGEPLPLLVRRGREMIELRPPVGAYDNLEGAALLDDETVAWALRLRHQRAGIAGNEPARVGAGLTGAAWVRAAFPDERAPAADPDAADPNADADNGERRGPPVVLGGAALNNSIPRPKQSFWTTSAVASEAVASRHRTELGRRMTAGVRVRAMLIEHERSLQNRVEQARRAGERTDGIEASLDAVRVRISTLDGRMTEIVRELDAVQPDAAQPDAAQPDG